MSDRATMSLLQLTLYIEKYRMSNRRLGGSLMEVNGKTNLERRWSASIFNLYCQRSFLSSSIIVSCRHQSLQGVYNNTFVTGATIKKAMTSASETLSARSH